MLSSIPTPCDVVDVADTGEVLCAVTDRIRTALHSKGYTALRFLDVAVTDSAVRLQGSVATYFLKQVAHTTVLAVVPHLELEDAIRVESLGC